MGTPDRGLIGRDSELEQLREALAAAEAGDGGLILIAGEAGIGKTRLARALAEGARVTVLRGAADPDATTPHGPTVSALRSLLRAEPAALDETGPLHDHLALILPELGTPPAESDQATLFEAIRCALAAIAPALVVLDDLQWSDDATLDLIAHLAEPVAELPVLLVGAYRSDDPSRSHSLPRLRTELRRKGALREMSLGPLGVDQTSALIEADFEGAAGPELRRAIYERTQGVPFFIEEVAGALNTSGLVEAGKDGFELREGSELPVPDNVRDAILIRVANLSEAGRDAAETASVAGRSFTLDLICALCSEDAVAELLDQGLIEETGDGGAAFRQALVRDAIYESVPWLRRRTLHCEFAERLSAEGGGSHEVAVHWQAANDTERARRSLVEAVDEFSAVHAYRDAAGAGRAALELWSPDDEASERLGLLERYAVCAELAGELSEAGRAWREASEIHAARGDERALAEALRRVGGIFALQGERVDATEARRQAAEAFAAAGSPEDAAAERLVAAGFLQRRGEHTDAEELAAAAREEARAAGRIDLEAEALGLQGVARAKKGDLGQGRELVNAGLSLALENGMTARAGSLYQCLGTVLETGAEYGAARDAMDSALSFCETAGDEGKQRVCRECMGYLLRELGEWTRASELCAELSADGTEGPASGVVSDGIRGSIAGFRGDFATARPLLADAHEVAIRIDLLSMQVDTSAALAAVAEGEGDIDAAASQCRFLLQRWAQSEDRHYAVWPLRWASSFFARRGDGEQTRACAEALGTIATDSGHADALAALAHAVGEAALLDGDAELAAKQFDQALDLHETLDVPFERAEIGLRAGVALAAAGRREEALSRLRETYRVARKLAAEPLMLAAAAEVAGLGEPVEQHLGARAAASHEGAGLTRRELEVVRLVAEGQKNKEIAQQLVISTRTVDMHVRNILSKLDCRSRVEAASRARELGLVEKSLG
jgi:DNA-binding CsgD family transcriptional regulator